MNRRSVHGHTLSKSTRVARPTGPGDAGCNLISPHRNAAERRVPGRPERRILPRKYDGHRSQEMPEREGKPGLDLPHQNRTALGLARARQATRSPQAQGPPSFRKDREGCGTPRQPESRPTTRGRRREGCEARNSRLRKVPRVSLSGGHSKEAPLNQEGRGAALRTQWGAAQKT